MWASMCQCSQHTIAVHLQTGPAEPGRSGPFWLLEYSWIHVNHMNTVLAAFQGQFLECSSKAQGAHGCSMSLCYGCFEMERRGKTCEQYNEVFSFICGSFMVFSCLFTFPDLSWPFLTRGHNASGSLWFTAAPAHLVEVKSWPFTSAARIHGAPQSRAAAKRNAMWSIFFILFPWKTLEDYGRPQHFG